MKGLVASKEAGVSQDVSELMQDAKDVDSLFTTWSAEVPNQFHYSSTPLAHDEANDRSSRWMYPWSVDTYEDVIVANTWNLWRMSRIRIHSVIKDCAMLLQSASDDHAYAVSAIRHLVNEICSSVPFQLGFKMGDHNGDASFYPHGMGDASWLDKFGVPETLGGYLPIQPLGVAVGEDCVPLRQRLWMREYLETVNKDPGELAKRPLKVNLQ